MYRFIIFSLLLSFSYSCQTDKGQTDKVDDQARDNNNIRHYLSGVASEMTNNASLNLNNLQDWESVRDKKLDEFRSMVSLVSMPIEGERSPLNVKYTGTIQMDGYRIEKLSYESLPDLYVQANLYIPDGITESVPAVLYLCGHARTQKTHYQAHPRKFAELGFVCLIVETVQYGEVWGEHWGCYDRGWFNWYSRGYTPAGVEVWNGIRGLDLLSTLPEVDPDKILYVGNGSMLGSWMSTLSNHIRRDVVEVVRKMTSFELSEVNSFHDQFIASLFLPHTDISLFGGVSKRLSALEKVLPGTTG